MPENLTRKQLYNLVWKKPTSQIAKEYGLSDRGLGKLCERHGIPTPPRGYWAKVAAGQKPKKPPLLFADSDKSDKTVLSQIKKVLSNNPQLTEEFVSDEMKEVIEYERDPKNKIIVPKKCSNFHKVIKKYEEERLEWTSKKTLSSFQRRKYRILSTFLYALEDRNFNVYCENTLGKIKIQYEYDYVFLGIYEITKRQKKILTEQEKRRLLTDRDWAYKNIQTGELALSLYCNYDISFKTFKDTENSKIEDILNEAIIAITKEIISQKISRIKRQEEEKIRYEEQKRQQEEQRNREKLLNQVRQWVSANEIRAFVNQVKNSVEINELQTTEFINWETWALNYARELDPICIVK